MYMYMFMYTYMYMCVHTLFCVLLAKASAVLAVGEMHEYAGIPRQALREYVFACEVAASG